MNLYRVTLRNEMPHYATDRVRGTAYVVAPDAQTAYEHVRDELECRKIGFSHDRELHTVELLASTAELHDTKYRLYLPDSE